MKNHWNPSDLVSLLCCQQPAEVEPSPATTRPPSSADLEGSNATESLVPEDEVAQDEVSESEEPVHVDPYYVPVGDPKDVPRLLQMLVGKFMLMPPFGGMFSYILYTLFQLRTYM